MADHNYFANLIWQIADLLRGPYRPPQYERVMLPMTVLRRFDCVLAPTKAKVLAEYERRKGGAAHCRGVDKRQGSNLLLLSYLLTILMLCGPAAADDFGWCVFGQQGPAVVVEGKVAKGESFERQIGPNLVFRLATEPGGWSIVVTEPGKSDNANYAGVVHLPLRFDYTLYIQARDFVEGSQFPGKQRGFQFVLNASDCERVSEERAILLWPYSYPKSEVDEAEQFRARSKCGKGKLEIKNVILAEDKDTIRELSFRGEFSLPQ